tara:strand:+ start:83 stop:907 length:825 start_codon:yes stop_codon:yes gene_type:complete
MIVARIIPKDSNLYERVRPYIINLSEFLDKFAIMQLFAIWSLTVAGTVIASGINDRFMYWDWSSWNDGLLRLAISSILFIFFIHPKSLWIAGSKKLNETDLFLHCIISLLFIFIGAIGYVTDWKIFLFNLFPYLIGFIAGLLVFQFTLVLDEINGEWVANYWENKLVFLSLSSILFGVATLSGIYFDDPLLSTVAMVNFPFPLVALIFPNHVRHLQRARFYPLLIFSLFLSVRAPWFLIPLATLFYFIRTINYFRYGIVYPSFGVDFDESSQYV